VRAVVGARRPGARTAPFESCAGPWRSLIRSTQRRSRVDAPTARTTTRDRVKLSCVPRERSRERRRLPEGQYAKCTAGAARSSMRVPSRRANEPVEEAARRKVRAHLWVSGAPASASIARSRLVEQRYRLRANEGRTERRECEERHAFRVMRKRTISSASPPPTTPDGADDSMRVGVWLSVPVSAPVTGEWTVSRAATVCSE
jgi:hypothetical protein